MTEQIPSSFTATKPNGKTVTVDPAKKKYRPASDDSGKNRVYYEGGTVNGILFDPGYYFWSFWLANEVNHEPSQVYIDTHPDVVLPGNSDNSTPTPVDSSTPTPAPDDQGAGGYDTGSSVDTSSAADYSSSSSSTTTDFASADVGGGSSFDGGGSFG